MEVTQRGFYHNSANPLQTYFSAVKSKRCSPLRPRENRVYAAFILNLCETSANSLLCGEKISAVKSKRCSPLRTREKGVNAESILIKSSAKPLLTHFSAVRNSPLRTRENGVYAESILIKSSAKPLQTHFSAVKKSLR